MIFNSTIISNGGGLYASIFATGVAQSDTVTLTTPSGKVKSGKWATQDSVEGFLFEKISEFGTYMLTASNGTLTVNKTVLVDVAAEYQAEIEYKLWLYREGDECEDTTGGWYFANPSSYSSSSSLTKNADNMKLWVNNANYRGTISMNNQIDLTAYSKLHIDGDFSFGSSRTDPTTRYETFPCKTKLSADNVSSVDNDPTIMPMIDIIPWNVRSDPTNTVEGTNQSLTQIEYDVSDLNGLFYLWFMGYRGTLNMYFKNIWLE